MRVASSRAVSSVARDDTSVVTCRLRNSTRIISFSNL